MTAYHQLAPFYDSLTEDVDYGAFLHFYESVFALYGKSPKSVLDIGCGTGTLTCMMAGKGYDMIGADASEDMLSCAMEKAWELPEENRPLFLRQSMERLDLYGTVEAAVCCLDGVNYLDRKQLRAMLRRLRLFVEPGGLFVFDINSPEKLHAMDGQAFVDETENVFCVWRGEFDESIQALRYGMDIFSAGGKHWNRDFEEHIEYLYTPEELKRELEDAGFGEVKVFGQMRLDEPKPGDQRLFLAARNERRIEACL